VALDGAGKRVWQHGEHGKYEKYRKYRKYRKYVDEAHSQKIARRPEMIARDSVLDAERYVITEICNNKRRENRIDD
jgi:hypothetical protein